jgi:hypothetical protein
MQTRSVVRITLAALSIALLAACASTRIINRWEKPGFTGPAFKKVLVAAVFKQDVTMRSVEDAFVRQMAAIGVTGLSSYNYLPNNNNPTKEQFQQALQQSGAEALLLIRLDRVDKQTEFVPGYAAPGDYWAWSWDDGYYVPPMAYQFDIVVVETKLFDVKTQELVWGAITETVDPHDTNREIAGFAKAIIQGMRKDGVL